MSLNISTGPGTKYRRNNSSPGKDKAEKTYIQGFIANSVNYLAMAQYSVTIIATSVQFKNIIQSKLALRVENFMGNFYCNHPS